ncbi:MAG: hypothetical protein H6810_10445 [Phycisphaeraceae bacterium]|nr:MAG: hypothetical protein H6810_10445 [Phycisphaeraceae bacterium]
MTHRASGNDAAIQLENKLGEHWRGALDRVLSRQLELYGELDALCNRQRGLIEANDADRLVGLLGERSRVVQSIADTADHLAPFTRAWGEIESTLDDKTLRDLKRRLDVIASIAASVAERDAADGEAIKAKRNALADRLAGLDRSKAAVTAYGGPRPSGARMQDRKG